MKLNCKTTRNYNSITFNNILMHSSSLFQVLIKDSNTSDIEMAILKRNSTVKHSDLNSDYIFKYIYVDEE